VSESSSGSDRAVAAPAVVQMLGICKRFGALRALDDVSLTVYRGRVSALLGENGAGKSTLMQVLAGLYLPDAGTVEVDGAPLRLGGPQQAIAAGVGMVHQHFQLVPTLSVAENVLLGAERPGFWLGRRAGHDEIAAICRANSMQLDPAAPVWSLSVGQRQQVEILKVLYRGARILILDEPTAVLTPLEIEPFFTSLRALVAQGVAVVLITHKLHEVLAVADTVTVLRRGRVAAAELPVAEVDADRLGRLILGEAVDAAVNDADGGLEPPALAVSSKSLLRFDAVSARGRRGELALDRIDLAVGAGEIVGIAGVSGNGQRELAEVLVGLRPATSGRVILDGTEVTTWSVRRRLDHGLGYVPEDRQGSGLAPSLSVARNLALRAYRRPQGGLLVRWRELDALAAELVGAHDVRLQDLSQPAAQLSGGNAQKLILAREIDAAPRLLVAAQPTRGLDLGATHAVRARLRGLAGAGCGVLLISEDLEELLALSHRVAVLFRGQLAGVLDRTEASPERVGRLMLGPEAAA